MLPYDPTANRYVICRALARRTRMIHGGAPLLGVSTSRKPHRIAQDEYHAGLIPFRICSPAERQLHIVRTA